MGIGLVDITQPAPVLIVEAYRPDRAASVIGGDQHAREARIVLASLTSKDDLALSIQAGASDWLTVPLTPQQLTAALARARRKMLTPRAWDSSTCLPQVYLDGNDRPVLRFECETEVDPFAVAWTLRRFSRGYDELGVSQGAIVLVLRASARDVPAIAARMRHFVDGSARVTAPELISEAPRRRFEVTG
jgi:hypothetical protein